MLLRRFGIFLLAVMSLAQTGPKSGIDRSTIDISCKPCDDFWRYATGAWNDRNPIPAQYASWGTIQIVREDNAERLKAILEAAALSKSVGDERRIGDYYAACLDTDTIDGAGLQPIQASLGRIAGITDREGVVRELVGLQETGGGFAVIVAQTDRTNSTRTIAGVRPGGLSLPDSDYYLRQDTRAKEIRDEFVKHVTAILVLGGDTPDLASSCSAAPAT